MRYSKWYSEFHEKLKNYSEPHYFPILVIRNVIKVSAFCIFTFRKTKVKSRLSLISVVVMASVVVCLLVPGSLTQMSCCLYQTKVFGWHINPPPRLEMSIQWLLQVRKNSVIWSGVRVTGIHILRTEFYWNLRLTGKYLKI